MATNANLVPGTEVRVTVSGDEYLGEPELRVLLDGQEIGRIHVAARHDLGEWETLSFNAPGVIGPENLSLEFVEDAFAKEGDRVIGDRNLWIAKVEVNGTSQDALLGRLDPAQLFESGEQEHGYVLPQEGSLRFALSGEAQKDVGAGQSRMLAGEGDEILRGSSPVDVAVFRGSISGYDIEIRPDGGVAVTDLDPADGDDGTHTLCNIPWAEFADRTLQLEGVWQTRQLAATPIANAFYVDPEGDDNGPGTAEAPFATLARARDAMRADPSVDTTYVRPGDYWFDSGPLELTAEDSGVRFIGLSGPDGAKPVLHGGTTIEGFDEVAPGLWTAPAQKVGPDLSVNGTRVSPALPGEGEQNQVWDEPTDWNIGVPLPLVEAGKRDRYAFEIAEQDIPEGGIPEGTLVQVFNHHNRWFDQIVPAKGLEDVAEANGETAHRRLHLAEPVEFIDGMTTVVYRLLGQPAFVSPDVLEFGWSSESGEVSIGSSEEPANVVAAQQHSIVRLNGADDVGLYGLSFADTLTPIGAFRDEPEVAAISLVDSDNALIAGNDFTAVGRGIGIVDSSAAQVLGNDFTDLGSEGMRLAGDSDGTQIAGNRMKGIGSVLVGSVQAVNIVGPGEVDHATIAHNTFTDSGRGFITTGLEKSDSAFYGLRILNNTFEDFGNQSGDNSAIHTFSLPRNEADSGTIIDGNIIRDVAGVVSWIDGHLVEPDLLDWTRWEDVSFNTPFWGNGIYLDVDTNDVSVTRNLIEDISYAAVDIFGGDRITVDGNYALLDAVGGHPDWGGDKFLNLHERWSAEPSFFFETVDPGPHTVEIAFENVEVEEDRVYLESLTVNGKQLRAPELADGRFAQWVTMNDVVSFSIDISEIKPHFDAIDGQYLRPSAPDEILFSVDASYVGDDTAPTFRVLIDGDPVHSGAVPKRDVTVNDISVTRNVVQRDSLPDRSDPLKADYIVFDSWPSFEGVPLEAGLLLPDDGRVRADENVIYNMHPFVDVEGEDAQALAPGFSEDENSLTNLANLEEPPGFLPGPLVPDDSTRGYDLNGAIAIEAGNRGVEELGANGLDLWSQAGTDGFTWREYAGGSGSRVPPAGTPSGHTWDVDSTQHVVYRDADGRIQELWFDGHWHQNDLTEASGGAPLAAGSPTGYTWDVDPTQHVVYRDNDGRVQELWFDGVWHQNDLTEASGGAPPATGAPSGFTWEADAAQHVVYRDREGHVQNLSFSEETDWQVLDLTNETGAPIAAGSPVGYTWDADESQHVIYRDNYGRIWELYKVGTDGAWTPNELTGSGTLTADPDEPVPLASGKPAAYTYTLDGDKSQHVIFRDAEGQLQELYFLDSDWRWHHSNLTEVSEAPRAEGSPAGYAWEPDNTQHVAFRDAEGAIHELFYWPADGTWYETNPSERAGNPSPAIGNPDGYTWSPDVSQHSQHVVYPSREGNIQKLFYKFEDAVPEWLPKDLSIAAEESLRDASGLEQETIPLGLRASSLLGGELLF